MDTCPFLTVLYELVTFLVLDETESIWYVSHYLAYCTSPGWWWWCGRIGGKIGRGSLRARKGSAPVPLCPPQIPHGLTLARTRSAAIGSQWLTAWPTAWPYCTILTSVQGMRSVQITVAEQCKAWTVLTCATLRWWVGIPLEARMFAFSCLCVVLGVHTYLATSWSPVQGVLPTVYRIKKLKKRRGPNNGL
jgi:hypothetical protein